MDIIDKFLKFGVVGFSGVFVDFAITYLCKEFVKLNKYTANSIGFICAASSNYILNRIWTFGSTDPHITKQYITFIAIALVGLTLNNALIWLMNDRLKIDFSRLIKVSQVPKREKINFYTAKLIAIGCVTVWNFLMNYFFNF